MNPARHASSVKPTHDQTILWRTPVLWWAVAGVTALACEAVILGQWIAAGKIHSAPRSFNISTTRMVILWAEQAFIFGFIAVSVIVLVRQCRREREITLDAVVMPGLGLTFWMTSLLNYNGLGVVMNRAALNISSWEKYVPGWHGPAGPYYEAVICASGGAYFSLLIWVWGQRPLANAILRNKPHWGTMQCLLVFISTGMLVDFVFELILVPFCGIYAYLGANHSLSLFGGHWYQLPLFSIMGGVLLCAPVNFMLYQARRRGSTVHIFGGSDHLPTRMQALLRLLAGIGFCAVVMFSYKLFLNLNVLPLLGSGPIPTDTPGWLWPTHR